MRILRARLDDGSSLDLHPAVSVIADATARQRDSLRRTFHAVTTGLAPGAPALLEAHGILLDATQDDLDLLEVPLAPALALATRAELSADADASHRLRQAERDLLLLAADRAQARRALAHAEATTEQPTHARLRDRAAALRARIARHAAQEAEPVRAALDGVRDRRRAGVGPDLDAATRALSAVGLDVADLGLDQTEVVHLAEDWLAERQAEAAAVVGAGVELRGIERTLAEPEPDATGVDLGVVRARAARATDAHLEAIDRVEALHASLAPHAAPSAAALEAHLVDRLVAHRPARLAGAVPLLVDGAFEHLGPEDVGRVLDRVAALAGGVQLVVIDLNPAVRGWAVAVGIRRAALVAPAPGSSSAVPA